MALIDDLKTRIAEVSPAQAHTRQGQGAVLIDVRDDAERDSGTPANAVGLSRGFLELRIAQLVPALDTPILTLCGSGQRSLLAADTLQRLGYASVTSVAGGFRQWKVDGLPIAHVPGDADTADRYARQIALPNVGAKGQARLAQSSVVVLGAGGLGSPAMLYLAAAGVGRLTLIDDDFVERSNLHRQVVHADARVGMAKVESARMQLLALNPRIEVHAKPLRLDAGNVDTLIAGHDVLLDGADNFTARYVLAEATRRLGIPMVYGAIERFAGQISVFDPRRHDSPCYGCLFPEAPYASDLPNCAEAGVLGVLPGTIGLLQATEVLKLLLDIGEPLVGRLLQYDALAMGFREFKLKRQPDCPSCGGVS